MFSIGVLLGAVMASQKGLKYALIAAGLMGAAQVLDVFFGRAFGLWLAHATLPLFQ